MTKECAICGFDKIVDFYHIDKNKSNNSNKNVVGLCPNHHRMANNVKFRDEILLELKKKGFDMPLERNLSEKQYSSPDSQSHQKPKTKDLVNFTP